MDVDQALDILCQEGHEQRKAAIQKINEVAMLGFEKELAHEKETNSQKINDAFRAGLASWLLLLLDGKRPKNELKALNNICLAHWVIMANTSASKQYLAKMEDQCRGFLHSKFNQSSPVRDWIQEAWLVFIHNFQSGNYQGNALPGVYLNSIARFIGLKAIKKDPSVPLEIDVPDESGKHIKHQLDQTEKEQWLMGYVNRLKTNCKDI